MIRNSADRFKYPGIDDKGILLELLNGKHPRQTRSRSHATFVPNVLIERFRKLSPGRQLSKRMNEIGASAMENGWRCLRSHIAAGHDLSEAITSLPIDSKNPVVFSVFELKDWKDWNTPGYLLETAAEASEPLARRWAELFDKLIVPFDAGDRLEIERRLANKIGKTLLARRRLAEKGNEVSRDAEADVDDDEIAGEADSHRD
jgi:hypothetical protein